MIGYYVHHQGSGHLHRAQAIAEESRRAGGPDVTGLSTRTRPLSWTGHWVQLPRDDRGEGHDDPTAGGQLHWAPLRSEGVLTRAAVIAAWLERTRPDAVVVDVSVEVTLLVRLHGVPVVSFVLPGRRTDVAHLAGFRSASALVAAWPASADTATHVMSPGLPADVRDRIVCLGALSRFSPRTATTHAGVRARADKGALMLQGTGGEALTSLESQGLEQLTPGWSWRVLGGTGEWTDDPSSAISEADVVVTGAGQGAIADVAAMRRPAVVVPAARPFDEQLTSASLLAAGEWPVSVVDTSAEACDAALLARTARMDGSTWEGWHDGVASSRLLAVVDDLVTGARSG